MRKLPSFVTVVVVLLAPLQPLYARPHRSRGRVSGVSRGSYSRSGNTASWQSAGGRASGSGSVTRTETGATGSRQTRAVPRVRISRELYNENKTVERTSTATTAQGETATRERTTEAQGGYATVEGSAKTSTGREAEGQAVAGRTPYGQPAVAGSVNTKYYGSYAGAAKRNPGGGYTAATVGPYGGKVTTTLPSGYRLTSYHGRSYYAYGGAY